MLLGPPVKIDRSKKTRSKNGKKSTRYSGNFGYKDFENEIKNMRRRVGSKLTTVLGPPVKIDYNNKFRSSILGGIK